MWTHTQVHASTGIHTCTCTHTGIIYLHIYELFFYLFFQSLWKQIVAFMHIYVKVWCLGMCVGMLTYKCSVHVCMRAELRTWRWKSPAITLHLIYPCTVSQLNPELIWLAQPASLLKGTYASGFSWNDKWVTMYGFGDLNSDSLSLHKKCFSYWAICSVKPLLFFFHFLGEKINFTYFEVTDKMCGKTMTSKG